MNAEKIVDLFVWGGLNLSHKINNRLLRFLGVIIAFLFMVGTSPIWLFIAIYVGFMDIWRNS